MPFAWCCGPSHLLQTLAALGFFNTRRTPHPLWRRTLLARDPARRVTLREPGAWLRELNKQSDAFTAPARAVRSFTSQYPQPQSPLVDLNWMRNHKMCGIKGEWLYRCFWIKQWFFERVLFRFVLFYAAKSNTDLLTKIQKCDIEHVLECM